MCFGHENLSHPSVIPTRILLLNAEQSKWLAERKDKIDKAIPL